MGQLALLPRRQHPLLLPGSIRQTPAIPQRVHPPRPGGTRGDRQPRRIGPAAHQNGTGDGPHLLGCQVRHLPKSSVRPLDGGEEERLVVRPEPLPPSGAQQGPPSEIPLGRDPLSPSRRPWPSDQPVEPSPTTDRPRNGKEVRRHSPPGTGGLPFRRLLRAQASPGLRSQSTPTASPEAHTFLASYAETYTPITFEDYEDA